MAAPRSTGPALIRTYIKLRDTLKGRRFQVRIIDVQTQQDVKCSASTVPQAVRCAKERIL